MTANRDGWWVILKKCVIGRETLRWETKRDFYTQIALNARDGRSQTEVIEWASRDTED